jgi:hypothetical protein
MKMKKINFITYFVLLFSVFTFTSCDNEPIDPAIVIGGENPGENPGTTGVFKADFDGQTFTTNTTMAYISGGSIIMNAVKTNGESFSMILDGTTPGTYPANPNLIGYSPAGSEYAFIGTHPTDENANTGSIIVTSVNTTNNTISGTFSFTGYWSDYDDDSVAPKQFTNGVFTDIPYTSTNPTGDTFDATLNGNVFNDTDILVAEISISGQDFISVAAENLNEDSITVSVRDNLTAGTYAITGNVGTDLVQVNFAPATEDFGTPASSGSVTITEKTATRIKGTFNGTVNIGDDTFTITGGAFDVEY